MLITAWFSVADPYNQSRCPSTGKTWYTEITECYLGMKNEILTFEGKLMELKIIRLSKIIKAMEEKYGEM